MTTDERGNAGVGVNWRVECGPRPAQGRFSVPGTDPVIAQKIAEAWYTHQDTEEGPQLAYERFLRTAESITKNRGRSSVVKFPGPAGQEAKQEPQEPA